MSFVQRHKKCVAFWGIFCFVAIVVIVILAIVLPCKTKVREGLNKMPGLISPEFSRKIQTPRKNFDDIVEKDNLFFANEPTNEWSHCEFDAYWNEEGAAEISSRSEIEILEATYQMHSMSLEVVDKVVNDPKLLRLFHIPSDLWPAIRTTWNTK